VICQIQILHTAHTDPYYNLATEKHLLDTLPEGCCRLYLWQNRNTVVIGRNQNAWAECRTSLLEEEGGLLARRLSGGGAVYHDLGNLNFTFLTNTENYDVDRQLQVIQKACASFGIATERSGRNDILAQGSKFSGNAFYQSKGASYHHGTLLINADIDKLSRYLSPSKAKLEAKGVSSVRSRVINLSQLCPGLTCGAMADALKVAFSQVYGLAPETLTLHQKDQAQIQQEAKKLADWNYLYGNPLPLSFQCEGHFSWGHVQLNLQVDNGIVTEAVLYTDAMDWSISEHTQAALTGCRFSQEALCSSLSASTLHPKTVEDLSAMLRNQQI